MGAENKFSENSPGKTKQKAYEDDEHTLFFFFFW